jgi:hypothetical protein
MRENYPDFLFMKCNAHICCLYFITSNPGILHRVRDGGGSGAGRRGGGEGGQFGQGRAEAEEAESGEAAAGGSGGGHDEEEAVGDFSLAPPNVDQNEGPFSFAYQPSLLQVE